MLCGTNIIPQNIFHIQPIYGKYYVEYCQSHKNIVMDLNNVMYKNISP